MLDFSEVARVLGASWVEKMFLAFEQRTARIPRVWPGTQVQARRLAAAYFSNREDRDRLAIEVQRVAVEAWDLLAAADENAGSPPAFAAAPSREARLSQP